RHQPSLAPERTVSRPAPIAHADHAHATGLLAGPASPVPGGDAPPATGQCGTPPLLHVHHAATPAAPGLLVAVDCVAAPRPSAPAPRIIVPSPSDGIERPGSATRHP